MLVCSKCGNAVRSEAKFCSHCGGAAVEAAPAPSPRPDSASLQNVANHATRAMHLLEARTMSPEQFLSLAKRVPLGRRPQGWWDLLAILGGATAGALWFLYGSVRATRFGWGFTIALAAPLIFALVFHRRAAALVAAARAWIGKQPIGGKLIGAAGIVMGYRMVPKREGLDLISPLLMVAIPIALVWFRKPIDAVLVVLRPIRALIPLPIRVGIGLAIPFASAYYLYNRMGISQYPLMQANTLIGTLLSYAVIRTPPGDREKRDPPRPPAAAVVLLAVACLMLVPVPAVADDFLRDVFNLNDGLRTPGWAPVIAGVSTVVVTILVNGVEVVRTVVQSAQPPADGEQPEHKNFSVVVNSADNTGARSTTITKEKGGVIITAHCEKEGARFPAGDPTIVFALTTGAPWIALKDEGSQGGERKAVVTFAEPEPESEPPKSCSLTITAGSDGVVSTSIELSIEKNDFELFFF